MLNDWNLVFLSQGKMECLEDKFQWSLKGLSSSKISATKARAIGAWGVIAPTFLGLSHQQISFFRNPSNPYGTVGWHTTNENRKGTRSWSRTPGWETGGNIQNAMLQHVGKTEHDGGNQRATKSRRETLSHGNFATNLLTLYTPWALWVFFPRSRASDG